MANDSFHQLLPTARYPGYRAFAGWQSQRQPPIVFSPLLHPLRMRAKQVCFSSREVFKGMQARGRCEGKAWRMKRRVRPRWLKAHKKRFSSDAKLSCLDLPTSRYNIVKLSEAQDVHKHLSGVVFSFRTKKPFHQLSKAIKQIL